MSITLLDTHKYRAKDKATKSSTGSMFTRNIPDSQYQDQPCHQVWSLCLAAHHSKNSMYQLSTAKKLPIYWYERCF